MITVTSIGMTTEDKLEDSLIIGIHGNRVTIHIGANMIAMYWEQFETLMQKFVLAWDAETRKRTKQKKEIEAVTNIDVGVGDAIKLDDSIGGK